MAHSLNYSSHMRTTMHLKLNWLRPGMWADTLWVIETWQVARLQIIADYLEEDLNSVWRAGDLG